MVQSLTLLRHGRTEYNAVGRFQGHVDVSLDALGLAQAEAVAGHLARTASLTAIVSSDLRRTAQTADAVSRATGLPVHHDAGLREISVGDLAHLIARLMGQEIEVECDQQRLRPSGSEVERLLADNSLARTLLGWEPEVDLEQGLLQTIDWMSQYLERYRPGVYVI